MSLDKEAKRNSGQEGWQGAANKMAKGGGGQAETVHMFADADAMKEEVHKTLEQAEYDVAMYYWETGYAQAIARSSVFGNMTLMVITLNALWIGIDVEWNKDDSLNTSKWYFQVGEYFFCAFFFFEWGARFGAFKRKRDGFRDRWFCFDSALVAQSLLETFVLPYALPAPEKTPDPEAGGDEAAEGGSDLGQLSMLRMLRLLRLTRMVRLMRAVPELVTLLRSMTIALRSVLSTLGLLIIFMYIFAIIFKSQLKVDPNHQHYRYLHEKFGRVPDAMWTLLLSGTFLDNITICANRLLEASPPLTFLFIIFVMLSSFTVLNMLVGLLCEVVDAVASAEKEKVMVTYVKSKLMGVLQALDEDGNGTISRPEFNQLLEIPEAVKALTELGVDVQNLVSLSDHLFETDEIEMKPEEEKKKVKDIDSSQNSATYESEPPQDGNNRQSDENSQGSGSRSKSSGSTYKTGSGSAEEEEEEVALSFADFLEMVIRLRSTNTPSVLDLVDLRKLIMRSQRNVNRRLDTLEEINVRLSNELQVVNRTIECLSSKDCMSALVDWCSQGLRQQAEDEKTASNQWVEAEADFSQDDWDIAKEGLQGQLGAGAAAYRYVHTNAAYGPEEHEELAPHGPPIELGTEQMPGKAFSSTFLLGDLDEGGQESWSSGSPNVLDSGASLRDNARHPSDPPIEGSGQRV